MYDTLANKAAFAVGLLDDNESSISLFKPVAGSRIVNEDISLRDGQMVPWTIGAYLNRARKSAESMSFGVGFLHLKAPVKKHFSTCSAIQYNSTYYRYQEPPQQIDLVSVHVGWLCVHSTNMPCTDRCICACISTPLNSTSFSYKTL